jgi:hypothetical protein
MTSYQSLILDTLENDTRAVSLNAWRGHMGYVLVSRQMRFANCGQMIASHPTDLRTLAAVHFDFQDSKVHMSINECAQPGQPAIGPRRTGIYWWTPGKSADDGELPRLRADWRTFIETGVIAGLNEHDAARYYGEVQS